MGIVTTGSEVFEGRIKDAFTPIIEERCAEFGVIKVAHEIVTDNTDDIVAAIDKVKAAGADIIFCTGGMSVDPDDLTPGAIKRYANRVVTYGLPVLPGSMAVSYTHLCRHYLSRRGLAEGFQREFPIISRHDTGIRFVDLVLCGLWRCV